MKIAVIYASTTGNTEAMANAINEALKASGEDVVFGAADSADRLNLIGAVSVAEPLMVHLTPEAADVAQCKDWALSAIK